MISTDNHIQKNLLQTMQARIDDFSRRNQNLNFQPGTQKIQLKLNDEQLENLIKGNTLHFKEEHPFTPNLNLIRRQADKNYRELGFNQLKFVWSVLEWEHQDKHFFTPLFLSDAQLNWNRGVANFHSLEIDNEPSLNPILIRYWKHFFQWEISKTSEKDEKWLAKFLMEQDKQLNICFDSETEPHRFQWKINNQSQFLGNFDFRKMALSEDYERLLNMHKIPDSVQLISEPGKLNKIDDQDRIIHFLPCDPSQEKAILHSLNHQNSVWMGPPGTGKSQSICNLLANAALQGKNILFVCEKNTALNAVEKRLNEVGLNKLFVRLHHSKKDRKNFIEKLGISYREIMQNNSPFHWNEYEKCQHELTTHQNIIEGYFEDVYHSNILPLAEKIRSAKNANQPYHDSYPTWEKFELNIYELQQIKKRLSDLGISENWARFPLAKLHHKIWNEREMEPPSFWQKLAQSDFPELCLLSESDELIPAYLLCQRLKSLDALIENQWEFMFYPHGEKNKTWLKHCREFQKNEERLAELAPIEKRWIHLPENNLLKEALELELKYKNAFVKLFHRGRKKAKQFLEKNYNLSLHPHPDLEKILRQGIEINQLKRNQQELARYFLNEFNIENVSYALTAQQALEKLQEKEKELLLQIRKWDATRLSGLMKELRLFEQFYHHCQKQFLHLEQSLSEQKKVLLEVSSCVLFFNDFKELIQPLHLETYAYISEKEGNFDAWRDGILLNEILRERRYNYRLKNTSATQIEKATLSWIKTYDRFREQNTALLIDRWKKNFQKEIFISEQSAGKLTESEKELKAQIRTGRRLVEREISKRQRFKSPRELMENGAGKVMYSVFPIWMMSPYSLSENLDFANEFDLLVVDEASQLSLEDAIPALVRANNVVVVGDTMQMPPGNFFQKQHENDRWAESLLEAVQEKLPQQMLQWHYRSSSETLIQNSNKRFYGGALNCIPAPKNENPYHFSYCENSNYQSGKNPMEATFLVEILANYIKNGEKSLAVISFSLEQQQEIEEQWDILLNSDPILQELSDHLNEPLLIRNLENIQGEERDLCIISTTYGPDKEGKLRQHFGPVNQMGGDKRLNVLFTRSREKKHFVSSFLPQDLHHENEAIQFLKREMELAFSSQKNTTHLLSGTKNIDLKKGSKNYLSEAYSYHSKNWELKFNDAYLALFQGF